MDLAKGWNVCPFIHCLISKRSMVIGKGLVAENLSAFANDDTVLIFASGVSNSKETAASAFLREENLLLSFQDTPARLVYFSTCSIFDPSSRGSLYVKHKKKMEELIALHFKNYLILRLPLLIAKTSNPFTFFNFIATSILKQERIRVQSNAWRYIFDAQDLKNLLPLILQEESASGRIVNMAYSNAERVSVLISMFEDILGIQAAKDMEEQGDFYEFDNREFMSLIERNGIRFDKEKYNRQVLTKYLKNFAL
jgi:hypothetical protein